MPKKPIIILVLVLIGAAALWRAGLVGEGAAAPCTGLQYLTEARIDAIPDDTTLALGEPEMLLLRFALKNETCDDALIASVTVAASTTATSRRFSALRLLSDGHELARITLPYATTAPMTFMLGRPLAVRAGATSAFELRGDVSSSTERALVRIQLTGIAAARAQPGTSTVEVMRAENGAQLTVQNPEQSASFR